MIRLYRPASDRPALLELVVELLAHERELEPQLPAGAEVVEAYLETILDRCARHAGVILVAELDAVLVGFGCVLTAVPPVSPGAGQRAFAKISDLVVLPTCRGRGIGTELVARAEEIARESGAADLYIGVLARNTGARRLYERVGFRDYFVSMAKPLGRSR